MNFVDPYHDIANDNLYYRKDSDHVDKILNDMKPIRVLLGLRRFGKTAFLQKINRLCQPAGKFNSWKSRFIRASGVTFPQELDDTRLWVSTEFKKHCPERYLILIDDLQEIDKTFKDLTSSDDRDDFIEHLSKAFEKLWQLAISSDGKLKIVLAEPTNFDDWLEGRCEDEGIGKFVKIFKRIFSNEDNRFVLSLLTKDETFDMLRAVQKDKGYEPALPEVSYDLAVLLRQETGGNPWLLAHAQEILLSDKDLLKDIQKGVVTTRKASEVLVERIKRRTNEIGVDKNLFLTIYMSLSNVEKFILRFLAEIDDELNVAENYGMPVQRMVPTTTKSGWKDSASSVFTRMETLGLIETFPGTREPAKIRSSFIRDHLKKLYGDSPIVADKALRPIWQEVLISDPFQPPSAGIIHQFSDVLFCSLWEQDAWTMYVKHLHNLKPEERPHVLVFCGNLLSAPVTDRTWRVTADRMCDAFNDLLKERDEQGQSLLQPGKYNKFGMGEVIPEQIIVVPGIYDRIWNLQRTKTVPEDLPNDYNIWGKMLAGADGLNTSYYYPIPNFLILPFDTVSTKDLERESEESLDQSGFIEMIAELRNLRLQLSTTFHGNLEAAAIKKYCTKTLTRDALFYSASGASHSQEFGYISPNTISNVISNAHNTFERGGAGKCGPLAVAVTHHYPYQQYSRNDLAFHGYSQIRKLLVEKGVSLLLHGHSPLQTCLSETIRKWNVDKTPFHMVGSGSFRPTAVLHDGPNRIAQDPPSFNVIKIEPKDSENNTCYYDTEILFGSIENGNAEYFTATKLKIKSLRK